MKHERLCELRVKKNMTHKKMAELLKISKSYYCQLENNKRVLSYEMAFKISKILNIKPDELFYQEYNK